MKKVLEGEKYIVYDDVLEKEIFAKINKAAQEDQYSIPHIDKWLKVWRINDGFTMGSNSYEYKKEDEIDSNKNYMNFICYYFKELAKLNVNIVGDWNTIILRTYLYGRNTKLSWHNDAGYLAAGIFYIHSYWASTWGGELLLANTPEIEHTPNPCIDHSFEDKFLEHYGFGQYITCKPNRIVLTKGGLWHSINKVDEDAGDNIRMSIVAFFK